MKPLDKFTEAFLEAALWASTGDNDEPLNRNYSISDFAPQALSKIQGECEDFQLRNDSLLMEAGTTEQNGHDFFLTRNGHGAGFWDRGYKKEIGEVLTKKCHEYNELYIYVGDDGKLYSN